MITQTNGGTCVLTTLETTSHRGPVRGRGVGAKADVFRNDTGDLIGVVTHVPQTGYAKKWGDGWWRVSSRIETGSVQEDTLNDQLLRQEALNLQGTWPNG